MTNPAKEDSSGISTERQSDETPRWFRCLSCGAPSPQFYFHYGEKTSKNNIQLTECGTCLALVDPYMEREWLLVIMDLILLRQEAFRHVFWNRLDTQAYFIHTLTTEMVSSAILPLLIFVPWISMAENLQIGFTTVATAFQRVYHLLHISSEISTFDPPDEHDLLLVVEFALILSMYCWGCIQRPQKSLPGFRYWHMVHSVIWFPLIGSLLVGCVVGRIWNISDGQQQGSVGSWEIAHHLYHLGLAAWILLWQVSGIQVVTTALSTDCDSIQS